MIQDTTKMHFTQLVAIFKKMVNWKELEEPTNLHRNTLIKYKMGYADTPRTQKKIIKAVIEQLERKSLLFNETAKKLREWISS